MIGVKKMDYIKKIKIIKNHFLKHYINKDYVKAMQVGEQLVNMYKVNKLTYLHEYPLDMYEVACVYDENGKLAKAKELYKQASAVILNKGEDNLTDEDLKIIGNICTNNAIIYQKTGKPENAAIYFKKAYNYTHSLLPDAKKDFADSCYNLGTIYKEKKRFGEAAHYYAEALNLRTEKDILYADNLFNLGICYVENSCSSIGFEFIKNSLEIYKLNDCPDEYIAALNFYGALLYSVQNYSEAHECYNELCTLVEQQIGTNSPAYAYVSSSLANCCSKTGDGEMAIRLKEKALNILKNQLSTDSVYYLHTLEELAHIHLENKDYEKGAVLLAEVLDGFSKSLGLYNDKCTELVLELTDVYWKMNLQKKSFHLLNYALNNIPEKNKAYEKLVLKLISLCLEVQDGQGLNEAFVLFNKIHPEKSFDEMLDMAEDIDY